MIVTILIPCRNEEANIEECIRAIYSSKLKSGLALEVLVADGLSDDGTLQIIERLKKEFPTLQLIHNEAQVAPAAFNLGINNASGDFLQIIGARQVVSENYVSDAVDTLLENKEIWCVGGAVENVYMDVESKIIGQAMGSAFGVGGGNFRIVKESCFTDTVGTPMYPIHVFEKVGQFDENLVRNQDDEFNYRVIKAGGRIFLNAQISIKYYVRGKVSQLKRQYYQYGYWKVIVNKKHKTITTIRQLFPLFLVLGLMIGLLLSAFVPYFWMLILLGVLAYIGIAVFFAKKAAQKNEEILKIGKVFAILHFSYGFGYLVGLWDSFVLRKSPGSKVKELSR